ncbi:MAG: hypothetical protein IPH35_00680 [Rhodoferax sp.]|nr:hypothetical protein [Rhodoferax sp.]
MATTLPTLSITPSNAPAAEDNNNATTAFTFLVTRTGDLSAASSATWSVAGSGSDPANATDFTGGVLPTGTVNFAAGASTATITVNVNGDNGKEANEGFTVTLSNPNGATLGTSSVGTSLNQSASGGYGVTENYYTLASGSGAFTLSYDMYGIPDRADIYVNGTLAVSTNGEVSNTGTLTVPSTFTLKASDIVRVVMTGTNTGTAWDYTVNYQGGVQSLNYITAGTIINDDTQPATALPSLSIAPSNAPAAEGNNNATTPFTFVVTRTGDLSAASSATWSVAGSGSDPANATDFTGGVLPTGTVNFAAGASTATITVNVNGDNGKEANEGFTVTLSNPNGATLGTSSVGTSLNQSASGGYGVTENFYTLAGGGGAFTLSYDMYGIPDRADIYVNGTLAVSTNGEVSNTGTLTVPSTFTLKANDVVRVVMTGTNTGTAWDYTVNYQGGVQSLNYITAGTIVNDDTTTTPTLPSYTVAGTLGNDFFLPSGNNNYLGGGGNDTYIISPYILSGAVTAKITDTEGTNVIQLIDGMTIAASSFFNNAVQLTLSNGAKVQILGASGFSYQVGANASWGDTANSQTYAQFAATLGASVPAAGAAAVSGTANYVVPSNSTSGGIDLSSGTVTATAASETFVYDYKMVNGRATKAGDDVVTITGFSTTNDKLVFNDVGTGTVYTKAQFLALAGVVSADDPFTGTAGIFFDPDAGVSGGVYLTGVRVSDATIETLA